MSRQTRVNLDSNSSQYVSLDLTSNQNQQLFDIYRRKTEQKKQNEIVKSKQAKDLVDKITKLTNTKTQLKMKLMKRELETRIAVIIVVVIAVISAIAFKNHTMNEKNDMINEILSKVQALNVRYVELSQEEIVKIFLNKFKLSNFYRLRHMRDL
jgi:hypothetical protein